MILKNKDILEKANECIRAGDHEGFLNFCTEDTVWTFVGDRVLRGKEAVRQYIATAYKEPPKFNLERLISEDDFVVALGTISMKDDSEQLVDYSYCDVWRFRDNKMFELKAYVIEINNN